LLREQIQKAWDTRYAYALSFWEFLATQEQGLLVKFSTAPIREFVEGETLVI
jgi:hypothetical protein